MRVIKNCPNGPLPIHKDKTCSFQGKHILVIVVTITIPNFETNQCSASAPNQDFSFNTSKYYNIQHTNCYNDIYIRS